MPVVTINKITRPEHLVEYIADKITGSSLGFRYVGKYNENLLPEYPAVQIFPGPVQKEIHGTHTFAIMLRADIYVLHAKMTEDRQTRSYNDMVLATNLVALLEDDLTMGDRVIAGWVESETPGVSPPRTRKGEAVVSTRISYQATQETRFK